MADDMRNDELEFEQMMEQRIRDNFSFASPAGGNAGISDVRLQELNKKLPSWSLEPPSSFLK